MDDSSSAYLALIFTLIVLNALITLAYAALMNSRYGHLEEEAEAGNARARRVLKLLDARSHLIITYNLSNVLLHFSIALLASLVFVFPAMNGDTMSAAAAAAGMLLTGLVTVLLGDIVPEGAGSVYADPLAMILSGPMRLLVALLSPLTWLLLGVSRLLARLFGGSDLINTVTEEEIMTLVNAGYTGGTIEDEEKAMIYSVLRLDQTHARELMTPRPDIVALDVETGLDEALDTFIQSGFSRIPVYEESIDRIAGLLFAKDLLEVYRQTNGNAPENVIRDLARPAFFVPEMKPADELLRELQNRNVHMAIVVDEYGGTSGLVTIEDLIEEIVGDIRDEHDANEEYEYVQISDNEYLIEASMDLDDVNELLDVHLDKAETDTLGGFIYARLGRVPQVGEVIETDELTLTVQTIDGRRIRKVHVLLKSLPEDGAESAETDEVGEPAESAGEPVPGGGDEYSPRLADAS